MKTVSQPASLGLCLCFLQILGPLPSPPSQVSVLLYPFGSPLSSYCTTEGTEAQEVEVPCPRSHTRVAMGPDHFLALSITPPKAWLSERRYFGSCLSCIPLPPLVLAPSHLGYRVFPGLREFSTHSSITHLEEVCSLHPRLGRETDLGSNDAIFIQPLFSPPFSNCASVSPALSRGLKGIRVLCPIQGIPPVSPTIKVNPRIQMLFWAQTPW